MSRAMWVARSKSFEAPVDIERFQQGLLQGRVFAEAEGRDVDEGLGVGHSLEEGGEFSGAGGGELEFQIYEAGEFGAKAQVFLGAGAGFAGERADPNAPVRRVGNDGINLGAAEALEEQIGRAVVVFLAG